MIDTFSLLLSHGLVFVACWRLLSRLDLDDERQEKPQPIVKPRKATTPDA
tara:strand:+ start:381 stop:530 length:150 start_codon:yes stop_codon:yes gene_type:complete